LSSYKKQLKDNKQKNDQMMEVIRSQEELIGKLKQNLMIAVQNNKEQIQLIPYSIRIPRYETWVKPKSPE
jgi:hypothetical protein